MNSKTTTSLSGKKSFTNTAITSRKRPIETNSANSVVHANTVPIIFSFTDIAHHHVFPQLLSRNSIQHTPLCNYVDLMHVAQCSKMSQRLVTNYCKEIIQAYFDAPKPLFSLTVNLSEPLNLFLLLSLKYFPRTGHGLITSYIQNLHMHIADIKPAFFTALALKNFQRILNAMNVPYAKACSKNIESISQLIEYPYDDNSIQLKSKAIEYLDMLINNRYFEHPQPIFELIVNHLTFNLGTNQTITKDLMKLLIALGKNNLLDPALSDRLSYIVLALLSTPETDDLHPSALQLINILANQGFLNTQNVYIQTNVVYISQTLTKLARNLFDPLLPSYIATLNNLSQIGYHCLQNNSNFL